MPVYQLGKAIHFPDPEEAEPGGLLAIGGDLEAERLLYAYSLGIFPWYDETTPILWHSPDPRMVLLPEELHVPRSLAKTLRRRSFDVRLDTAFDKVIRRCAEVPRPTGEGTWITPEMIDAYCRLHELGFAHSVEAWQQGELVGGLYGVSIGACFFAESMFAVRSDASKVAFVTLVRQLRAWRIDLVDCQIYSNHLARFGARDWSRRDFLARLARGLEHETRRGFWRLDDPDPEGAPP